MTHTYQFQAEIQQLLHILVHSLYTERDIFLRELISNASDALNRVQFEMLTNREITDPDAELAIEIKADEEAGTLTISDTGIGMTEDDLKNNLGVIARSGAKAFIQAMQSAQKGGAAQDVIGQFGVGFYSVFMVADKVRVVSRPHHKDSTAFAWESEGGNEFSIEPAEREARGTDVIITMKEDAKELLSSWKIKDIIRRHSDYIAFPIYVGDEEEATNKQTAIWRQDPKEITAEQYDEYYKMHTLDFEGSLHHIHMRADVPLQFYALLYFPKSAQPSMLSPRKEPGLKLYARKVLIQDYCTDLLPEYLQFVQGVVDSEDLPLNVNRESVQANKIMVNLKKTLTGKVLSDLKRLASKEPDQYRTIFTQFGRYLKQALAVAPTDRAEVEPLLRFATTRSANPDEWVSLEDYVGRMAANQTDIYYILGDDFHSVGRSPHLDAFRQRGIEVLCLTDPVDPIMLMGLDAFKDHKLRNVDESDIDLSAIGELQAEETPAAESLPDDVFESLRAKVATILGDRVKGVQIGAALTSSPARLVSDDKGAAGNMYRVNRLFDRDYELPVKTLELNPRHALMHNLSGLLAADAENPLVNIVIEQLFETALLQEGLHPDPASMASRLTALMEAATGSRTR
jgi:molecular chaperone HtpG